MVDILYILFFFFFLMSFANVDWLSHVTCYMSHTYILHIAQVNTPSSLRDVIIFTFPSITACS